MGKVRASQRARVCVRREQTFFVFCGARDGIDRNVVDVGGLCRHRGNDAACRLVRLRWRQATPGVVEGGGRLVARLGHRGDAVRRRAVVVSRRHARACGRQRADDRLRHRLPGREVAGGRQRLRVDDDLQLLRGAARVAAPRAAVRHRRRDRAAHDHDLRRQLADQRVPLAALRLRRLPDRHRHQDGVVLRARPRPGQEPAHPLDPQSLPDHREARGRALLRRARRRAHDDATLSRPGAGRNLRRDLRGRQHPGDLRDHHRPLHRADLEPVRHPRPARDVLPARRPRRPLRAAQVRTGGHPGLHRHQDADRGVGEDPGAGLVVGGRHHPGLLGVREPVVHGAQGEGSRQDQRGQTRSGRVGGAGRRVAAPIPPSRLASLPREPARNVGLHGRSDANRDPAGKAGAAPPESPTPTAPLPPPDPT